MLYWRVATIMAATIEPSKGRTIRNNALPDELSPPVQHTVASRLHRPAGLIGADVVQHRRYRPVPVLRLRLQRLAGNVPAALAQAHTAHRGMVVELPGGYRGLGSPIKLSRTPASYRFTPLTPGEAFLPHGPAANDEPA